MTHIGLLGSGALCIGKLEEEGGDMFDVFILLLQPPPQGAQGVACALVSPFQPFGVDKAMKKIDKHHIVSTISAPSELASVYMQKVTGIVTATPKDVAMVSDRGKNPILER